MTNWPAAMPLKTAAAYLGYESTAPIEQLLRAGKLIALAVTPGGDRRIRKKDLDEYLDSIFEANTVQLPRER